MSFLNKIKSAFSKKKGTPEISLETLAYYPLFQMLNEDTPFDDWRAPDASMPEELEDIFKSCVWMYQIYMFYMLAGQHFGSEIADKVLRYQVDRLSVASEDLSQQLEIAVEQIHRNVNRQFEKPYVAVINNEEIEMPLEYAIALEFLVRGEDALFHVDDESIKKGDLPEMGNADIALTECLCHGKQSAISYFGPVIEQSKVTL